VKELSRGDRNSENGGIYLRCVRKALSRTDFERHHIMNISPSDQPQPWMQVVSMLLFLAAALAAFALIATRWEWTTVPLALALSSTKIYLDVRTMTRRQ